uniref:Uncharacterized protein n=1 Tax=Lepeophtheirus salmonis TaxID=72036 RepID=A0A0K2TS60_LEPSM
MRQHIQSFSPLSSPISDNQYSFKICSELIHFLKMCHVGFKSKYHCIVRP